MISGAILISRKDKRTTIHKIFFKISPKINPLDLGSGKNSSRIPDLGGKKALDPGS
jgi:hypothetical protein